MNTFSGWQYLLIDAANNFGHDLDKKLFEERIQWATDNLNDLESLVEQAEAKTKPLYVSAVLAIRKAQKGIPTGHMVGLDACCSGIQVMSALTGCVEGARSTGMVDPNVRADAYTRTTAVMAEELGGVIDVSRKDAKQALMTSFYGSKKTPKEIFGEGTEELEAFYRAALKVAPGAWELLQDLLGSWQPYALQHSWKLPDGFDARVKVMAKKEIRIEVDELDHASFTYEYFDNEGQKTGLSNVANVTHSVDGWILRSMHRRCNYDREMVERVNRILEIEVMERVMGEARDDLCLDPKVAYYREQYTRSTVADAVILPHLNEENVKCLTTEHVEKLTTMVNQMLEYKPFELVTVHDEFKAHPNNLNHVRKQYINIMAEIAESELLNDLLSQIYGYPGNFSKLSFNLPDQIRQSAYALS